MEGNDFILLMLKEILEIKINKFKLEKIRQDEYLREAEKKAIMTPEEQRLKIKEITGGLFKNVSKV